MAARISAARSGLGVHVEQDRTFVADEAVGPAGDHQRADQRRPAGPSRASPASAPSHEADDHEHRHRRVGQHVDNGAAHVVVAMVRVVAVVWS